MNKFTIAHQNRTGLHWQLLATASALTLIGSLCGTADAKSADGDRPLFWMELGGQLSQLTETQEPLSPPFVSSLSQYGIFSPLRVQKSPRYGLDAEGKISFEPDDSSWMLSASLRYGRSSSNKNQHQQTPNARIPYHISVPALNINKYGTKYPSSHVKFADAASQRSERHILLDFQAGKDVGLGILGGHGSSALSAGIRIAQFSSKSNSAMHLEPDVQYPSAKPITTIPAFIAFHSYAAFHFHDEVATENSQRNFRGLGPSLAWNASAPLAGSFDRGEITLDWGANAAVLFGRQKVKGHHQTTVRSYYRRGWGQLVNFNNGFGDAYNHTQQTSHAADFNRERSVVVPNFGGFAGISYRYADAKLSFGYRADFFFGAMDGGIDARKSVNVGFHGPFASISVGLGD